MKTEPARALESPAAETPAPGNFGAAFPIVGIGASAGGIEAVSDLLDHLGPAPGVAVIFVLHQDRNHASLLADVLTRATELPVAV
ncbi:MAG TPA: chemotaxis protein CheB, partial [Thermoanaerobaculia bacterium]|nr:chemotaxis protein CheB [Thermoanaerobaculia bacterium]